MRTDTENPIFPLTRDLHRYMFDTTNQQEDFITWKKEYDELNPRVTALLISGQLSLENPDLKKFIALRTNILDMRKRVIEEWKTNALSEGHNTATLTTVSQIVLSEIAPQYNDPYQNPPRIIRPHENTANRC